MTDLKHDSAKAADYVIGRPGIPVLSAAHVDPATRKKGVFETRSFPRPSDRPAMIKWIEDRQGKANIYYSLNSVRRPLTTKAERTDIKSVDSLHVDLDPRAGESQEDALPRILAKLDAFRLPPSRIIGSGGGVQAIWDLEDPIQIDGDLLKAEDAKLYNIQLERELGGDHCHNIDRIMRVPYTVNVADVKKQHKGRKDALATVITDNGKKYPLAEFTKAVAVQDKTASPDTSAAIKARVHIPGNLESVLLADLEAVMTKNGHPPKTWLREAIMTGAAEGHNWASRSEGLFAVVAECVRCGVPDEMIASVIQDPDYKISAPVLDKRDVIREVSRVIERAHEAVIEPMLAEMNRKHFVISCAGGKCRIGYEYVDPVMGWWQMSQQTFQDIRNRYNHLSVAVEVINRDDPTKKDIKMVPLGDWWIEHKLRRQYDGICFAPCREIPNYYNMWRGFGVPALPGDCSLWLDHARQNICSGDETIYQYLINWCARLVQCPGQVGEVAIALRGKEGTGKGLLVRWLLDIVGQHGKHLTNTEHLTGKFNWHMRDAVLVFADEAYYAGDKRHESSLKTLITEDTLMIEQKGADAIQLPNYTHTIIASNNAWIVPASSEARRFCVIDVAPTRMQDTEFFSRLEAQRLNGGTSALLHFLMSLDIRNFDVWKFPRTEALRDQQEFSLEVDVAWWEDKLQTGEVFPGLEWGKPVVRDLLRDNYVEHVNAHRGRPKNIIRLTKWLTESCFPPNTTSTHITMTVTERLGARSFERQSRLFAWVLPPLDACRAHWLKTRANVEWTAPTPELRSDAPIPF